MPPARSLKSGFIPFSLSRQMAQPITVLYCPLNIITKGRIGRASSLR